MAKYIIILACMFVSIGAKSQLWEQVGGNENISFGGIYADTVENILYAQGVIDIQPGIAKGVLKYNGQSWDTLSVYGLGFGFGGVGVFSRYQDKLVFGSGFALSEDNVQVNIAQWNSSGWEVLGSKGGMFDTGPVNDILVVGDNLYVAGHLNVVDSTEARGVAKWDGTKWAGLAPERFNPLTPKVSSLTFYKNELYAGGQFKLIPGNEWNIAKWDGIAWQSVGGGLGPTDFSWGNPVADMTVFKEELYIGGHFPFLPVQAGRKIVRWDGNTYKTLGAEEPEYIEKMIVFNGELYVSGRFSAQSEIGETSLAKWDGTKWCSLGSIFNGYIFGMQVFNGELYISGDFTQINGEPFRGVVKWTGGDYVATCGTPLTVKHDPTTAANTPFHIQPNPSENEITLVLEQSIMHNNGHFTAYNSVGNVVWVQEKKDTHNVMIPIHTWPPGIYLFTLESETHRWTKRFVKL